MAGFATPHAPCLTIARIQQKPTTDRGSQIRRRRTCACFPGQSAQPPPWPPDRHRDDVRLGQASTEGPAAGPTVLARRTVREAARRKQAGPPSLYASLAGNTSIHCEQLGGSAPSGCWAAHPLEPRREPATPRRRITQARISSVRHCGDNRHSTEVGDSAHGHRDESTAGTAIARE
jgi:hypothetical protein